eukprot:g2419.t1
MEDEDDDKFCVDSDQWQALVQHTRLGAGETWPVSLRIVPGKLVSGRAKVVAIKALLSLDFTRRTIMATETGNDVYAKSLDNVQLLQWRIKEDEMGLQMDEDACIVQFADREERAAFSNAMSILCPSTPFQYEGTRKSNNIITFDCGLQSAFETRILAAVDIHSGLLSISAARGAEKRSMKPGAVYQHRDRSKPYRVSIETDREGESITLTFPSRALRTQFCKVLNESRHREKCRELRLVVSTWNTGGSDAPSAATVQSWLPKDGNLYAIGLQECTQREKWTDALQDVLATTRGCSLIASIGLLHMQLLIFADEASAPLVSEIRKDSCATGVLNTLGNKGATAVSLRILDGTSICFVSCHLAARAPQQWVLERAKNFRMICANLKNIRKDKSFEFLHQHDHVLWMGDLNYRVQLSTSPADVNTEEEFNHAVRLLGEGRHGFTTMLEHDQLRREMQNGNVFEGFQEGGITFPPTYRWTKGKAVVSNKKNQSPSYTDRVLWRSAPGQTGKLRQLSYSSNHDILQSDHRPVVAEFALTCVNSCPNSNKAGMFMFYVHSMACDCSAIDWIPKTTRCRRRSTVLRDNSLQTGERRRASLTSADFDENLQRVLSTRLRVWGMPALQANGKREKGSRRRSAEEPPATRKKLFKNAAMALVQLRAFSSMKRSTKDRLAQEMKDVYNVKVSRDRSSSMIPQRRPKSDHRRSLEAATGYLRVDFHAEEVFHDRRTYSSVVIETAPDPSVLGLYDLFVSFFAGKNVLAR